VLSAWRGWRPLASDPHAAPGAPVSRDHVVSHDPATGVTFCAGGKWTTWREMAEDLVDEVVARRGLAAGPCATRALGLRGRDGFEITLPVMLTQKYGLTAEAGEHLARTYGGKAWEVLELARSTGKRYPRTGVPLAEGYPYLEAEVRYACREHAVTVEDVLSRRTRLAFLNSVAAADCLDRVADIMAEELGWSAEETERQRAHARLYVHAYGGPAPDKSNAAIRAATEHDLRSIFDEIDSDGSGTISTEEVRRAAELLGFPVEGEAWVGKAFDAMDADHDGTVDFEEFAAWWNLEVDEGSNVGPSARLRNKMGRNIRRVSGSVLG